MGPYARGHRVAVPAGQRHDHAHDVPRGARIGAGGGPPAGAADRSGRHVGRRGRRGVRRVEPVKTSDLAAVTLAVLLFAGLWSAAPQASSVTTPVLSGTAATFTNPVLGGNFADPGVLRADDGTWYAYATGDLTVNLQVARSSDLVHWERLGEALPRLPFWQPSAKGLTWAPEAWQTSAGTVLYYTARDVQAGRQCLAVAVAAAPEGPFVDESDEPLLCQLELGGS